MDWSTSTGSLNATNDSAELPRFDPSQTNASSEILGELLKRYSSGKAELDMLDRSSELYATIKALEKLERAYTRSDISSQDYTSAGHTHISQARTIFDTLRANYPDMRTFMEAHRMTCERAANRLQRGVPATLEHGDDMTRDDSRRVAADSSACTEAFITLGDLLTMHADGVAVDDLTDPLQVLIGRLNRAQYFVPQLEAKQKLLQWSAKLVGMRAADVVGPGDVRQLRLDVNNGYLEFLNAMKG